MGATCKATSKARFKASQLPTIEYLFFIVCNSVVFIVYGVKVLKRCRRNGNERGIGVGSDAVETTTNEEEEPEAMPLKRQRTRKEGEYGRFTSDPLV